MSRVAGLPEINITADGVRFPLERLRQLDEVRIRQRLSLPTLCDLTFAHQDGLPGDVRPGSTLTIRVAGKDEPLFEGEVTALEYTFGPSGERQVRLRGYDLLHRLRKRQSLRAHIELDTEALAGELVADLGLSVQASQSGPVWRRLIQERQSDFELLEEVAERSGLYFTARGDVLHLLTLDGIGDEVSATLGESLLEARVEVNGDPACREFTAAGWDPAFVEQHESNVSLARVGREVAAEVMPDQVGGNGRRFLVDRLVQDADQAESYAQAALDLSVAREVNLWGVAEGDPRLRPGSRIDVKGLGEELSGKYLLTTVTHTIDGTGGFISEISSYPPNPKSSVRASGASLGMVSSVEDPEGLGRIQVSLPAFGDVETGWMNVVSAGAGPGKGLVAIPDVGDRVLVLFLGGDPAQGIVLGGLYGLEGPPDTGVEGGEVKRFTLTTPGGQKVQLDDAGELLRVENTIGSYIELKPDRMSLHSKTDLVVEAPGRAVTISGRTIDFRRT